MRPYDEEFKMMKDWKETTLGEIATNFDSKRVPVSKMERAKRQGDFPYHGATGAMDYIDGWLFEGLHLLIAEDGSVETPSGNPFLQLVDGRFWVSNHAHVLKCDDDEDTQFLFYLMSTVQIAPFMSGSVQAKLSQGNLNRIPIFYPPKPERRAIANVLGSLDEQIELLRRQNATLERLAQTLFRAWFIEFEPVKARAAGIAPVGLDAATATLFPDSFEDDLPKGWVKGNLSDLANLNRASINPMKTPDTLFDHYSLPAFDEGHWPREEIGFEIKSNKFLLAPDCVLLSKLNPRIKRVWLPSAFTQNLRVSSTEFLVLQPSRSSAAHLFSVVSSDEFQTKMQGLVSGTSSSHQRVRPDDVLSIPIVIAKAEVLAAFSDLVAPLFAQIENNLRQARTLAGLRDQLLPRLIAGELRVPASLMMDDAN